MTAAPGLVLQLQSDAMDSSIPIMDLLRKAKAVAVKLKQPELADWLEKEMNGYKRDQEVPDYRKLYARLQYYNPLRGWEYVIGGDHGESYGGPCGEIQSLLSGEADTLTGPVSMAVIKRLSKEAGFDVNARSVISKAAVAGILEAVRNVIHDWALRLEGAGIHGEGLVFSPKEAKLAQSVVVNIGSITNATGIGGFGDHAQTTATQTVTTGQLAQQVTQLIEEVERALPAAGLPVAVRRDAVKRLKELKEEASAKRPDESQIKQRLAALQRVFEAAAGNVVAAGVVALIARIITGH